MVKPGYIDIGKVEDITEIVRIRLHCDGIAILQSVGEASMSAVLIIWAPAGSQRQGDVY